MGKLTGCLFFSVASIALAQSSDTALYKAGNRIRTVHTRHEQGSAYMALGAALATAKPQAFAAFRRSLSSA